MNLSNVNNGNYLASYRWGVHSQRLLERDVPECAKDRSRWASGLVTAWLCQSCDRQDAEFALHVDAGLLRPQSMAGSFAIGQRRCSQIAPSSWRVPGGGHLLQCKKIRLWRLNLFFVRIFQARCPSRSAAVEHGSSGRLTNFIQGMAMRFCFSVQNWILNVCHGNTVSRITLCFGYLLSKGGRFFFIGTVELVTMVQLRHLE